MSDAPWDEELKEENDLLARLKDVEKLARVEAQNAHAGAQQQLLGDLGTLIRAYRRKWHEANELKDHLNGIRRFLKESWDEEDEDFDPSMARDFRVRGHWCPTLIEETSEMLQDDTVYVPHAVPQELGEPVPTYASEDEDDEDDDELDEDEDEDDD